MPEPARQPLTELRRGVVHVQLILREVPFLALQVVQVKMLVYHDVDASGCQLSVVLFAIVRVGEDIPRALDPDELLVRAVVLVRMRGERLWMRKEAERR